MWHLVSLICWEQFSPDSNHGIHALVSRLESRKVANINLPKFCPINVAKSSSQWWQDEDSNGGGGSNQAPPASTSNSVTTLDGSPPEKNRLTAGILALLVGGFGVHKFYLGYNNQGVILLLMSTLGMILVFPLFASAIIALSEAIIYLTSSDQKFYDTYEANQKLWF